jgi:hypothetical protein
MPQRLADGEQRIGELAYPFAFSCQPASAAIHA